MGLQSDKKTLQGNVQPWRCDLCGSPFAPGLDAICLGCGRLCCPEHRAPGSQPGSPGLCTECAAAASRTGEEGQ